MQEKFHVLIQFSLKFVLRGPIDSQSALVQVMALCLAGSKLLDEPMAIQFAGICRSFSLWGWFIIFNSLRQRQNGRRFADDTFKRIFLNENVRISIKISLKFVPKGPINNIPSLVQIMAWRRSGDKPLSEPMMVSLLTHICVTRPQWVTTSITANFCSKVTWLLFPNSFTTRSVSHGIKLILSGIIWLKKCFFIANTRKIGTSLLD